MADSDRSKGFSALASCWRRIISVCPGVLRAPSGINVSRKVAVFSGCRVVALQARRMASCKRPAKISRLSGVPGFHLPAVTLPDAPLV